MNKSEKDKKIIYSFFQLVDVLEEFFAPIGNHIV
jgi:hypothetical protein